MISLLSRTEKSNQSSVLNADTLVILAFSEKGAQAVAEIIGERMELEPNLPGCLSHQSRGSRHGSHRGRSCSPSDPSAGGARGRLQGVCLVKTWSARLIARWSRTDVGDLVPDSSGDPWSPPEIVRQHVKWDAAMVVEHECEQLRCGVEWHP